MNCPRCETVALRERDRADLVIDVCPECRGIWLDRGELEKLIARAQRELEDELRDARAPARPPQAEPDHRRAEPQYRQAEPEYRPRDPQRHYDDDRHERARYPKKRRWFDVFDDIFD